MLPPVLPSAPMLAGALLPTLLLLPGCPLLALAPLLAGQASMLLRAPRTGGRLTTWGRAPKCSAPAVNGGARRLAYASGSVRCAGVDIAVACSWGGYRRAEVAGGGWSGEAVACHSPLNHPSRDCCFGEGGAMFSICTAGG